jgi:hypothetical protein
MRLSGVDPGIIRELSGIYKPFVKAFKELVSNAYDADAANIQVLVDADLGGIEILDDGTGMTPFQFQRDFARLGGSTAWLRGGKSPGGRERIGYKGIGFLAVARYCSQLRVTSQSALPYRATIEVPRRNRKSIPIEDLVGDLVPARLLRDKVSITAVEIADGKKWLALVRGKDFVHEPSALRLQSSRALGASAHRVEYRVDCRHLRLEATLDFNYLLGLEHRADLRVLDDFCKMELVETAPTSSSFTRVRLHGLKDFVVRELSAPPLKGKARNIASKSGREQFLWRLARSSPIRDDVPANAPSPIRKLHKLQAQTDLPTLTVKWGDQEPMPLLRPIYLPKLGAPVHDDDFIAVNISEGGLRVDGYLLAKSEVLYPAELRGISVRVRNVTIGDASFLGWDHIMSGPRKAAMSQITGELIVRSGIEAADAINPGRESFYEENPHYRILRRVLVGSEETVGGLVGQAIKSILDRIRVRSQVTDRLAEARQRRKTLTDISSAVNFYSRGEGSSADGLTSFFDGKFKANGLSTTKDVPLRPQHKVGGFELEVADGLDGEFEIDYQKRRVRLDFQQDTWSNSVYLNGEYYEVAFKQGKPEHPICEFDTERRRIYVNWTHPVKLHMDDAGFLRSAILLRLAFHAAPTNADQMMDLALKMLAFRAE